MTAPAVTEDEKYTPIKMFKQLESMVDPNIETSWLIGVDTKGYRLIGLEVTSVPGTQKRNTTKVDWTKAIEMAKEMQTKGATMFYIAHSHPTINGLEDVTPSPDDFLIDKQQFRNFEENDLKLAGDFVVSEHAMADIAHARTWAIDPETHTLMHHLFGR